MLVKRSVKITVILTVSLILLASMTLAAADYPTKSITISVGWAAGGASDIVSRALAVEMEDYLDQSISVINVTGALGSIGATQVSEAPADGYNWFGGAAVHGTWPILGHADLSWEEFYAFLAVMFPTTIYVNYDAPWETLSDLVADIQEDPASFTFGHPGAGSNGEIFATLVLAAAGVDEAVSIPYSGGREAGTYLLAGAVDFISVTMGDVTDYAVAGTIRPLSNLYDQPVEFEGVHFPPVTDDLPQLAPYIAINPYFGIYVPRDVPEEVVLKVAEAFEYAVEQERFQRISVHERAGVLDPLMGEASDIMMAKVGAARGYPLYDADIAPNNPADLGVPTVGEITHWPPYEKAAQVRPWPERLK